MVPHRKGEFDYPPPDCNPAIWGVDFKGFGGCPRGGSGGAGLALLGLFPKPHARPLCGVVLAWGPCRSRNPNR